MQHPGGKHDSAIRPLAEKDVFKGRVPQIKDWLDAWGEVTDKVFFRKQERLTVKEHARKLLNMSKNRRKQSQIMAEARRCDIRLQLRAATCISFAMDDRKSRNIFGINVTPTVVLTCAVVCSAS